MSIKLEQPKHTHTIQLKSDGTRIDGLAIEHASDAVRDKSMFPKELFGDAQGVLAIPGGVTFLTKAGKKWHLKYTEFSFVHTNP